MNFKYRLTYRNEQFLGNDLESIAKSISKSKKVTIEEANKIVSKLAEKMVPRIAKDFNPVEKKSLSFKDVVHGASSMLKQTLGFSVDQIEINRRSNKCFTGNNGGSCPKLTAVNDCRACGWSQKYKNWANGMMKVFGKGYVIPNNLEDKFCSVCKCSLAAILPAQIQDFKGESEEKKVERPNYCWLK